jgi:predicted exporter
MKEPKHRIALFMAMIWFVLVLALCFHQVRFWSSNNLDSDVMALLPDTKHDPMVSRANDNMAKVATRNVVILIGSADSELSKSAALVFDARIKKAAGFLRVQATSEQDTQAALDFYARYRDHLLTPQQKQSLEHDSPDNLRQSGTERLYGIGASIGLSSWISDPLGLAPVWWQSRLGDGVTQEDGLLITQSRDKAWVILQYESELSAFQLDGIAHLQQLIESASNDAKRLHPDIEILNAGVPLHAEAAAVRASWEINTIGYGSLAAVMLLVFFAFMKFRPLVLVSGSLLIGCAAGISVTALIFGKVHLLTLVFGASLVGVAEDYGIHYFSSRQGNPNVEPFPMMRHLLPGMWLAFITSALAYLSLGMAPLPGLQQMAVFSATGLLAAFLTVVCWFPFMDKKAAAHSWLSSKISNSLRNWPRWQWQKTPHKFLALTVSAFVFFWIFKIAYRRRLASIAELAAGFDQATERYF